MLEATCTGTVEAGYILMYAFRDEKEGVASPGLLSLATIPHQIRPRIL
jgi:hypothetical protein